MDILLGVIISAVTELIKILSKKFGIATSKKIILGVVFVLCAVFTYFQSAGMIPKELITKFVTMLGTAVATYQLITKPVKAKLINE